MANLIITVISIALVAVAALMGAYYGGQAFMNGQAEAEANKIKNSFEQTAGAIYLYNSDNSTVFQSSGPADDLSFLVPKYLTQIQQTGLTNGAYWTFPGQMFAFRNIWSSMVNTFLVIFLKDEKACNKIEKIRVGTEPANARLYTSSYSPNDDYPGKIGCFKDNSNNDWGGGTQAPYVAYYSLYGAPIP